MRLTPPPLWAAKVALLPLVLLPYLLELDPFGFELLDVASVSTLPAAVSVALLLSGLFLLRLGSALLAFPACALLVVGTAVLCTSRLPLIVYPGLLNMLVAWAFLRTLGPRQKPLVQQFAEKQEPNLPAFALRYCRRVTLVWGLFLLLNGLAAIGAWWVSPYFWRIYNGALSYLLIGLLFLCEYITRCVLRAREKALLPGAAKPLPIVRSSH